MHDGKIFDFKNADQKSIKDLSVEIAKIAEKARAGLRIIPDNDAKINLENLIKFTSFKA